jgi:SEC-C motif
MEISIDTKMLEEHFPQLEYFEEEQCIIGKVHIECLCNDEYINEKFEIKIKLFKNLLPIVWELSHKIKNNYPHIYKDKKLCLATDLEQELYLKKHNLVDWIEEFVEKFFISYVYYERYGVFPFGEYSHGDNGIYEFIQKYLKIDNIIVAKKIYDYICTKQYRGHLECPCGSKKKIRNCHGHLIFEVINSKDFEILKEHFRRMNYVGRNK